MPKKTAENGNHAAMDGSFTSSDATQLMTSWKAPTVNRSSIMIVDRPGYSSPGTP
ncbi:MAG: hypothetical protein QGI35_05930 [Arenicellales bacterium]|nr:hypothetical protein [Arenicellales bacterium]